MSADSQPKRPNYYKFPFELFESTRSLPPSQAAKLCYAALSLYFDDEEPSGLPRRAADVMAGWRGRIKRARSRADEQLSQNAIKTETISSHFRDEIEAKSKETRIKTCTPEPPLNWDDDPNHCAVSTQRPRADGRDEMRESSSSTSNRTCIQSSSAYAPTIAEVEAFVGRMNLPISAKRFFEVNEARGWVTKSGKPIDDWRRLAQTWAAHERSGESPEGKRDGANKADGVDEAKVARVMAEYRVDRVEALELIAEDLV